LVRLERVDLVGAIGELALVREDLVLEVGDVALERERLVATLDDLLVLARQLLLEPEDLLVLLVELLAQVEELAARNAGALARRRGRQAFLQIVDLVLEARRVVELRFEIANLVVRRVELVFERLHATVVPRRRRRRRFALRLLRDDLR